MPPLRPARALALLGAALLTFAPAGGAVGPAPAAAATGLGPAAIYLLRGGDPASDAAVAAALRADGHTVELGVATPDFTGAQASLADYDLVVALYQRNSEQLDPAGAQALVDYVQAGGGLLAGEWLTWESQQQGIAGLAAILPAAACGINGAPTTTFSLVAPNAVINAGLPPAFDVSLGNFSGSETCLDPKPEAVVLYASSNAGGSGEGAGLVVWNPPASSGRVASFSTQLSATELAGPEMRRLFQNTAAWVAGSKDLTAPTIKSLTVSGAGGLSGERELLIDLKASDRGGAGLGSVYIAEYVYSADAAASWRVVQRSGWAVYGQGGKEQIDWQLTADPGVHYIQAFVADRAGNVALTPALDFVSYQPASAAVAQGAVRVYRIRPGAGRELSVRMEVASGNPDLYVFGPSYTFNPGSDAAVEEARFTSVAGVYQIEVEGFAAGRYRLSVGPPAGELVDEGPALQVRRRASIITLSAYAPEPEDADLPPAPATVGPASVGLVIYLPLLR